MSGLPALGLTLAIAIAVLPLASPDGGRTTPPVPARMSAAQLHADDPVGALAAGRLLVASRRVSDPNFSRSVILLFVYSANDGAAGVIVNRSTPIPVDRLLPDLPVPPGPGSRLFFGGPVGPPEARALLRMPIEREIRRGDWHVFDGDSDLVFDPNPGTLWRRQIALTELIAI